MKNEIAQTRIKLGSVLVTLVKSTLFQKNINSFFNFNKKAFTLAEVLITLTIIGVVSAITVPTLKNKMQNHTTYTALKKYHSIYSNAFMLANNEFGLFDAEEYNDADNNSTIKLMEFIGTYVKSVKICKNNEAGCWSEKAKALNNKVYAEGSTTTGQGYNVSCAALNDGSYYCLDFWNGANYAANYFGTKINSIKFAVIWVDINGNQKPNVVGRDIFAFVLDGPKLLPAGTYQTTNCTPNNSSTLAGYMCANKVISEKGVNY